MNQRRTFVVAGFALITPGAVRVQQPAKVPRVAMLWFGPAPAGASVSDESRFRQQLEALGYVDGQSVRIDSRYAGGSPERLDQLAREIAASHPDVIVTSAVSATAAARRATRSIPIVMVHAGNPVGAGLIESLARPGGNVTGTTSMLPDFAGKLVQLLHELVPRARRIAFLGNPSNAGMAPSLENAIAAARTRGIEIGPVVEVTHGGDFAAAFKTLRDAKPDALDVFLDPITGQHRAQIIAFAAAAKLPTIYGGRQHVREGGLISYGIDFSAHYPIAADYVSRILKGAKPGDLPVQQPTRFELAVNLKTARALGLTVPQSVLLLADEVIQ